MPYCQTDERWAGTPFDGGPDTFSQVACYVTCFANLRTWAGHDTTPPQMASMLAPAGLLVDESIQRDSALAELLPGEWSYEGTYDCEAVPCDPAQTDVSDRNLYRIMWMKNAAVSTHFVNITHGGDPPTIYDVYTCAESAAGSDATLVKGDWKANTCKIVSYRYHGTPVGPGPVPGMFTGTVSAPDGARVHVLPGTDQPTVPQPGVNPDVVDFGTLLTFDAWCHHPPEIADAITGQGDDRWFRVLGSGHWMASAVIKGNPPADM